MELWILFAFLAAIFAAANRSFMKIAKGSHKSILLSKYLFSAFPALLLFLFISVPGITTIFLIFAFMGSVCDILAISFMIKSLRETTLAHSVPLLSFTPVFLLLTGFLFLGEFPSTLGLLGVLIVVGGSYGLRFKGGKSLLRPFKKLWKEKGPRHMLIVALLFSLASVFFKKAILETTPFFTLAFIAPLSAFLLTTVFIFTGKLKKSIPKKSNLKPLLAIGLFSFLGLLTIYLAFQTGLVAYSISIKRLSILFNVLIGALLFKEEGLSKNLTAASIMIIGAFLIVIG